MLPLYFIHMKIEVPESLGILVWMCDTIADPNVDSDTSILCSPLGLCKIMGMRAGFLRMVG